MSPCSLFRCTSESVKEHSVLENEKYINKVQIIIEIKCMFCSVTAYQPSIFQLQLLCHRPIHSQQSIEKQED